MTIVSQQYKTVLNHRGALLLFYFYVLGVIITFFSILLPSVHVRTVLSTLSSYFQEFQLLFWRSEVL